MDPKDAIARLCAGRNLDEAEMAATVGAIMDGKATEAQIGGLLVALRMKGETVAEVIGAARAMRARAKKVRVPSGVIVDTCGTGGDGKGTINVSTLAALIVAACGVRVAKHGNRAQSSRAGSADLLEALGVDVNAPATVVERCLETIGIGFFFAPAFHGATKHVAAARREIGVRTLFNLLGPLTNPAAPTRQLVGVYSSKLCEPMAHALGGLGAERAIVVHGEGGLDEFAPTGETEVAEWRGDAVVRYKLRPRDFGLSEGSLDDLIGGDREHNAMRAHALLDGGLGSDRTSVVMTVAATLYVAGENGFRDGARRAEQVIDSGEARRLLERLVAASHARSDGDVA